MSAFNLDHTMFILLKLMREKRKEMKIEMREEEETF